MQLKKNLTILVALIMCFNFPILFVTASDVSFTLKEESINSLIALYTSLLKVNKEFSDFTTQKLSDEMGMQPISKCPNCNVYATLQKTQGTGLFLEENSAILGDNNMYLNLTAKKSGSTEVVPLILLKIDLNITMNFKEVVNRVDNKLIVPVSLNNDDHHTYMHVSLVENYIDNAPIHEAQIDMISSQITYIVDQCAVMQFNNEFPGIDSIFCLANR